MDKVLLTTPASTSQAVNKDEPSRSIRKLGDGVLGLGFLASTYGQSLLADTVTPKALTWSRNIPRVAGGLVTLATTAIQTAGVFKKELAAGSRTFPETQRSVFASSVSIAAGCTAGAIAGALAATATAVGAPVVVAGVVGAAGVIGVGYAVSSAREWAENWFDRTKN